MKKKVVLVLGILFSCFLKASLAQCSNEEKRAPHPNDCTKFYSCPGNFISSCGPGTHFNPKILACDWPNRAGCQSGGPENPPDSPGESSPPEKLPGPPEEPQGEPEEPPDTPEEPPGPPADPPGKPPGAPSDPAAGPPLM
ncbi:uncharacterized protein [Diabrotica undecimpunctata]|uniref:uncharacterized protein n=1 Tax=Diabrotica undecimpunctata TaxID=50387 RepID=UPI003B6415F9